MSVNTSLEAFLKDWSAAGLVDIARSKSAESAQGSLLQKSEDRDISLEAVAHQASHCTFCSLSHHRRHVVFGSGPESAELMILGEAPGSAEDAVGIPFQGGPGELLNKMLAALGKARTDVYCTTIIKCQPQEGEVSPESIAACKSYLQIQIERVSPKVLLILGAKAGQIFKMIEPGQGIDLGRGSWKTVLGRPARLTYHPAALLRDPSLKRGAWDDLQEVARHLGWRA